MSKPRTHILRVKPPWRDGGDRTRCGRPVTSRTAAIPPDDEMAIRAKRALHARYRVAYTPQQVAQQAAETAPPAGVCAVCWENLGQYGNEKWRGNPLAVIRVDLAITDDAGRTALAKELIALADLVAAHPAEFADLLEREAVLAALDF